MDPTVRPVRTEGELGEIVSRRRFDTPRAAVFAAFADPAQLALWWGPKGFTNTFREFDLRPGGAWRFTMHGPNGADYQNEKEFLEVETPARVVFRHVSPMHDFTMSMTYSDTEGGTELTWRMRFGQPAEGERLRAFISQANEENFDRLAAHLAKTK